MNRISKEQNESSPVRALSCKSCSSCPKQLLLVAAGRAGLQDVSIAPFREDFTTDDRYVVCQSVFAFFAFAFWDKGFLIGFAGTEDRAPLGSDLSAVSGQDRRSGRLLSRPGMPLRA